MHSQPGDRRCSQPSPGIAKFGGRTGIRYGLGETARALQACFAVLPSEYHCCQPRNWGLDTSKMMWTARSVQNKARLSLWGQMDTEQVYPWHAQGVASSTVPQAVVWQNRGDICCYNTKRGLKISCPMHFFPSHGERILLSCPFSNFPLFFPVFSLSLSLDVPSDSSLQWDVLSGSPTFALFSWNPQYMAGRASYVGKPGELGLGEMVLSFTDQKSPRKWRWAQNIHWFRYVLSPCFSRPMYLFIIYIIYTPMLESRVLWLL